MVGMFVVGRFAAGSPDVTGATPHIESRKTKEI
jgi:hypothetical protein